MIIHKSFVILACACLGVSASADVLSPEAALSRVQETSGAYRIKASASGIKPQLLTTLVDAAQAPTVYVFANPSETGFTILSADDNAMPVLAFSDTDSFDPNNIPDNCRAWLEMYSNEIAAMRQTVGTLNPSTLDATAPTDHPSGQIGPLMTTKWNQDEPYYNSTPLIGTYHAVTGCVATAMAQVMKYHNYPVTGTGSISYNYTINSTSYPLTYNFGATTFDWANMLNVYKSGSYNDTQANAVATLMAAVGASVSMQYNTSMSSTGSVYTGSALMTYFGYNPGITEYEREFYGRYSWEHLLHDQLANYGPVIYYGGNDAYGHCFVLDGYLHSGYFHFNWGWGGTSDGYYVLTALSPSAQGIGGSAGGFNQGQAFIGNIRPAQAGDKPTNILSGKQIVYPSSGSVYIARNTDVNLNFDVILMNMGIKSAIFKAGLAFVAEDGSDTFYIPSNNAEVTLARSGEINSIPVTVNLNLTKAYRIYPAYKARNEDDDFGDWQIAKMASKRAYIRIYPAWSSNYIERPSIPRPTMVSMEGLPTEMYYGVTYPVMLTMRNDYSDEFCGNVVCYRMDGVNKSVNAPVAFCNILPGEEITIEYPLCINYYSDEASMNLKFFSCIPYESVPADITEVGSSSFTAKYIMKPKLTVSSISMNSSDNSNIKLKFQLNVEGQGFEYGTITCTIYPHGDHSTSTSTTSSSYLIWKGGYSQVEISGMTLPTGGSKLPMSRASETYDYELYDDKYGQTIYSGTFQSSSTNDYAVTCGTPIAIHTPTETDPVYTFNIPVTGTTGTFTGSINARVFPSAAFSPGSVNFNETEVFEVSAGETVYIPCSVSIPNAEVGTTYYIEFSYYNRVQGQYINFSNFYPVTVKAADLPVTGLEEVAEEAEVVETELFNLSGMKIATDTPPAGLYIRRERLDDGTVRTTRVALH